MAAEFSSSIPQAAAEPRENVGRGALFSLATIPAGVAVWVLLWGLGFIASIVAALVAFLAVRLYVWGAGRLSRVGAVVVVAVTVVTLALAFFGGIVLDGAVGFGELSGLGTWGAFLHEEFWPAFWLVFPEAAPEYLPDLGWAVAFGALGSFATLRAAFAATGPVVTYPGGVPATASMPEAAPGAAGMPEATSAPDAAGMPEAASAPDAASTRERTVEPDAV